MCLHLERLELWDAIESENVVRKKDRQVMSILFSKISNEVTRELDVEKTAKPTWLTQKVKSGGVSRIRKARIQSLKRDYENLCDGELSQEKNTIILIEPRYALRKRTHPQLQQHAILFLTQQFEKLTIHEVSKEDLSKPIKESVDPMGINFPPLPFIN